MAIAIRSKALCPTLRMPTPSIASLLKNQLEKILGRLSESRRPCPSISALKFSSSLSRLWNFFAVQELPKKTIGFNVSRVAHKEFKLYKDEICVLETEKLASFWMLGKLATDGNLLAPHDKTSRYQVCIHPVAGEFAHMGSFIGSLVRKSPLTVHTFQGGVNLASDRGELCFMNLAVLGI